ncbi:MAG: putative hydroxymethylpyrimidine transporter CytX [Eubacterium sp.]|nr:putative hydroxymethylpyrimidine transporter CytX [Eubacterium sp.]
MENKKTSTFSNGLIWFGAGVSLAEIVTGTFVAPLGMKNGLISIVFGHVIGCILLFLAGLIGGREKKSSMESAGIAFGNKGNILFALLNVLQLVGWTGIMIYDGAVSAKGILDLPIFIWAIIIGGLIVIWIIAGLKDLGKISVIVMAALFILTIVLSVVIFRNPDGAHSISEKITFGAAVELSVAMPLSWFPVISDYTKDAENPFAATLTSSVVYGMVSMWMFVIGMGASIFAGTGDISQILLKSGLGVVGLIIIVTSTVTTTFLDAFSAGISAVTIHKKISPKWAGVAAGVLGTVGAAIFNMDDITGFLYLIGSVFAPMIAVLIADYFIIRKDSSDKKFDFVSLFVWFVGFVIYRFLMKMDIPVGNTLPDMLITICLTVFVEMVVKKVNRKVEIFG